MSARSEPLREAPHGVRKKLGILGQATTSNMTASDSSTMTQNTSHSYSRCDGPHPCAGTTPHPTRDRFDKEPNKCVPTFVVQVPCNVTHGRWRVQKTTSDATRAAPAWGPS